MSSAGQRSIRAAATGPRRLVGLALLMALAGGLWAFGRRGERSQPALPQPSSHASTPAEEQPDRGPRQTLTAEELAGSSASVAPKPAAPRLNPLAEPESPPGSLTLRTKSPRQQIEAIVQSGNYNSEHLLPFAMEAAMDLLLLTGRGQQVAVLSNPISADPGNRLRLVRNAGARLFVADAERLEFPWLFELAHWNAAHSRPLPAIVPELLESLSQLEAVCRQLDPKYPGGP